MKKCKIVNKKILITFVCSMISLLALSTILSSTETKKDSPKKVAASVYDAKAKTTLKENKKTNVIDKKEEEKVDTVEVYSKKSTLTEYVEPEPEPEPVQAQATPAAKQEESAPVQMVTEGSVGEYQAYAYSQFGNYGWTEADMQALIQLWNRESGWNPNSHSRTGAHGIPQALPASKMASCGEDYMTNYRTQINWGLGYISGRYGSPSAAWSHFQSRGWY